ncbi:hypothetical protein [Methylorubrum thiocyanatum]|nr:hypothetical protein [Methylorubrum thiocyanatum]
MSAEAALAPTRAMTRAEIDYAPMIATAQGLAERVATVMTGRSRPGACSRLPALAAARGGRP